MQVLRISGFVMSAVMALTLAAPAASMEASAQDSSTATYHVSTEASLDEAVTAAAGLEDKEADIIVDSGFTLTAPVSIPAGVTIQLSGASSSVEIIKDSAAWADTTGMFQVDGSLTLTSISLNGNSGERVVYVGVDGSFDMEAGSTVKNGSVLSNNTAEKLTGGGIYNLGTMTMNAGSITGCKIRNAGAGVYNAGTFLMNGGTISGNAALGGQTYFGSGGGVYNEKKFMMNGGTVSSNSAEAGGGISSCAQFTMNNGTVTENIAESAFKGSGKSSGGGIYLSSGTFTMNGGTVTANKAHDACTAVSNLVSGKPEGVSVGCGGGVYVSNYSAVFDMEGGSIASNQAYGTKLATGTARNGGGVYVQGGTDTATGRTAGIFKMHAGSITGNKAQGTGAGVYAGSEEYAIFTTGTGGGDSTGEYAGAATMDVGGTCVISGNYYASSSGNTLDNLYLPSGVTMTVDQPFGEGALVYVAAADLTEDAVLATYADGVGMQDSDPSVFCVTGKREVAADTENRRLYMAPLCIDGFTLSIPDETWVYTGSGITPAVTLKDSSGDTLTEGTDYTVAYTDNTDVGTGTITVTGINDYRGTLSKEFAIAPQDISQAGGLVSATQNALTKGSISYVYDGSAQDPSLSYVSLTDSQRGEQLLYNSDYGVSYKNDVNAGTASVQVTGMGNYTGTLSYAYKITPMSINSTKVTAYYPAEEAYTGKSLTPSVTLKRGSTVLKKGTDYTLSYKDNKNTGTASIVITGKGNYGSTRTVTFRIVPKAASIKTLTSTKSGRLTASWKKDTQASGYQLMAARDLKFTSGKKTALISKNTVTSTSLKGLKGNAGYYVSVRAYRTIKGKKYYGDWSGIFYIKVKG